ncbi:hypothetical protein [Shewanella youngdeokensis]|uniref:TetR family transcriptional regulator n=1 Tax=Shewanella youngdeokensis TaxID=2999068 RepID=A0ABZ0JUR4_9GAMM|nr:hypothetical protein RGE70_09495 [Shewanella sp. DAU334]
MFNYEDVLSSLDSIYDDGKLFSLTINMVAKTLSSKRGLSNGSIYRHVSTVNDFYVLLFNRNLVRWGVIANSYGLSDELNPKEKLISRLVFTSNKRIYSHIDNDIQYYIAASGLMNSADHQFIYDTDLIYKNLHKSNAGVIQSLLDRKLVTSNVDEVFMMIRQMKMYERGYSLIEHNKNINMGNEDIKVILLTRLTKMINELDWVVHFDVDFDKIINFCDKSSIEIMTNTNYTEEIQKLRNLNAAFNLINEH